MWLDILSVTNRDCLLRLSELVYELFFLQISLVESIKSIEKITSRAASLFSGNFVLVMNFTVDESVSPLPASPCRTSNRAVQITINRIHQGVSSPRRIKRFRATTFDQGKRKTIFRDTTYILMLGTLSSNCD